MKHENGTHILHVVRNRNETSSYMSQYFSPLPENKQLAFLYRSFLDLERYSTVQNCPKKNSAIELVAMCTPDIN